MSVNKVILIGHLGADPEIKYTPNGLPVASFTVATSEVRMKDGKREEKTEWHRVNVWGKNAENCKKFLSKGRQVFIEGRLQTRTWEKNNQKHSITEIVANTVQFLGSSGKEEQGDTLLSPSSPSPTNKVAPAPTYQQQSFTTDDIPF